MRSRLVVCVLLSVAAATAVTAGQTAAACNSLDECRQLALDAVGLGDFETFHDYAWLTVRKGRPNDPDLMYLLARAQSLSGRPHDALVMLRRIAALGVPTDADTDDDFRRVRTLAGWTEVAALIADLKAGKPASALAPPLSSSRAVGTSSTPAPSAPAPARSATPPAAAPDPLTIARPSFAPVGLAYDAVSRRFIAGDRHANKLMVLDEEFRRVNDLAAAASAGFFGLTSVEIDRARGDLWVANAKEDGTETALHRLQLISGRVLQVLPLPREHAPARFADIAVTPAGAVLALDALGKRVFRLAGGVYRAIDVAGDTLLSITALDEHTACIATAEGLIRLDLASRTATSVRGARGVDLKGLVHIRAHRGSIIGVRRDGDRARVVRIRLDGDGARAVAEELVADVAIADSTSMSVDGGTVHYLAREPDGGTTVRHIRLKPSR